MTEVVWSPSAAGGLGTESTDGRLIGGRYRVVRGLNKSAVTETLLAVDLTEEAQVVIKTAAAIPRRAVLAFLPMPTPLS